MGGLGSSSVDTMTGTVSISNSNVDNVAGSPDSRSSSLSSVVGTSPTTTGRSSLSSVTSVTPSDAERESSSQTKCTSQDGGPTPTPSARFAIDESVSSDVHERVEDSAKSTTRPPSLPFTKLLDESDSSRNSSPTRNLADRVSKKPSTRLTSPPTSSSSWSDLNKKWDAIQRTDT